MQCPFELIGLVLI